MSKAGTAKVTSQTPSSEQLAGKLAVPQFKDQIDTKPTSNTDPPLQVAVLRQPFFSELLLLLLLLLFLSLFNLFSVLFSFLKIYIL